MALKRIGGAWVKDGQKGTFISISLEIEGKKYSFLMFQNEKKEKETHPDYVVYERADDQQG